MKHLLLLATFALWSAFAFAQSRTVSGTIRDAEGNPLPGVAIIVPGTTHGTVTDFDGHYSLTVDGAQKLSASFIGYVPAEIDLAAGQTDATLQEESKEVDEVVVVAYGTSTKGSYTGSAAQLDAETIEKRQVTNASQALTGTMAGVQTQSYNGQPGTSATIRVRGAGSINADMNPLIVVDGMPFDGDLSAINTADIESMTVLKDAASTALYGARGANGIVMITTKKGRKGEAKINFEARWGANTRQVENYDVLTSAADYYEKLYTAYYNSYYYNEGQSELMAHTGANSAIMNGGGLDGKASGPGYQIFTVPDGEELVGTDGKINPNATLGYADVDNDYFFTPDNWEDETFKRQGRQQYDLSIAGGLDGFNYFFSIGYVKDGGVIENSAFERTSTRLKVDYQAKKWLKVGANAAYSHSKSRYPDEQQSISSSGNAFFVANFIAPIYPLYVRNADGSLKQSNGRQVYDYGDGSNGGTRNWMSISNPLADLLYNKEVYIHDIFNGNLQADITPIKGLTLTAKYGLYVDNARHNALGNAYMGQSASYGGTATQEQGRTYGLDQQYIGNYQWTIADDNAFDVTIGYDGYQYRDAELAGYGTGLYNPESYFLSNTTSNFSLAGSEDKYANAGFFGRLNYGYAEKYFANVSYRRDSSSRFSEDNRWGDFWSVSAAWLVSGENFMQDVTWVNMLKVKASYGEQGNDNIGNLYAYEDQYTISGANGTFNDATLSWKGNPDLTWETSKSWNAGVEFSLFANRLGGSVEYFGRKSDDMLYNKPVAGSVGYTSFPMNIGSMTNSGVEIDLTGNVLHLKNFDWNINANATFIKNEINKLHPDLGGKMIDGSRIYEEGESMYRYYMVDWAGVDEKTGEALYWTEDSNGKRVTTTDYKDAQNHKVCTDNLMPKVYGGFGTNLEFFGFDASASFSYQLGGKIWDYGYQDLMHGGTSSSVGSNWHKDINKAWTPENTKTDVPRLDYGDDYASSTSTRWICSSNYLALNNITFGYTLPHDLTRKAYLETVRVYFAADNVALWSYRDGLDPRQSFTYATTARYTAIRSISGGLKITF